jgi:hypothetical protein
MPIVGFIYHSCTLQFGSNLPLIYLSIIDDFPTFESPNSTILTLTFVPMVVVDSFIYSNYQIMKNF